MQTAPSFKVLSGLPSERPDAQAATQSTLTAGFVSTKPEDLAATLAEFDFLVKEIAKLHTQVNKAELLQDFFAPAQ